MLLMVETYIRGGICYTSYWYGKAINKYKEDCNTNKESSYLKCWDINNLYVYTMSQRLPLGGFKWVEEYLNLIEI